MGDQVFRNNVEALRRLLPQYEDYRNGTTGVLQSNGSYTDASAGLDAPYSWVVLDGNRSPSRVFNQKVSPRSTAGFPVETAINIKSGEREITRSLRNAYDMLPAAVVDGATMPGAPTVLPTTSLDPGRVEPDSVNGGLSIYVRQFQFDGMTAGGDTYDLTTEVGALSSSGAAMALVYVLGSDGQIYVEVGTEQYIGYVFTQADADAITLPAGAIPLAGLVLFDGQTDASDSFVPYTRYFDRRIWLGNSGDIYVSLTPDSATRNTIQPTGDYPALVLQSNAAQTVTPLQLDVTFTDPPSNVIAQAIDLTQALTANSTVGTTALELSVTLDNVTYNNTSSANRALQLLMFATGSAGTISNLLVTQQSMTISGGVAVTTVRKHRINDATVSGGSVLTNNTGLVIVDHAAGTNNVNMYLGPFGSSVPTGNWSIYNNSSMANYFAGKLGMGTTSPTNDLSFGGNAARILWMERHSTSNTAGNSLTVQAGGATSGATNKAGGNLIVAPGIHTGNATPALTLVKGYAKSASSGTTDATQVTRAAVGPSKVLTNNSATTILNATLASGSIMGCIIRYHIEVTNGTDYQSEVGAVYVCGVNKAGAFTMTINEVNSQQSLSTGTLATTWAVSSANPAAISINANSSLTPSTGYPLITYTVENLAQQDIAVA